MQITDLNPFVRYARVHTSYQHRSVCSICYDCRFFFLESGVGTLTLGGERHELSEGTAIFLPPATKYHFRFQDSDDFRLIVLDFDLTQQNNHLQDSLFTASEDNFDPARVPPHDAPAELAQPIVREAPTLRATVRQCPALFLEREMFYREKASALLKLCLIELIRESVIRESNALLCEQILQYIHKRCTSEEVTNGEIAEVFGYHPHYLSNVIRTHTGTSLHQYVIAYRLRLAKNMLLTTAMDVEEIAWRTGFCSASHFIRVFRARNGMTPRQYRLSRIRADL